MSEIHTIGVPDGRFKVFMVMKIQVKVFWVMMPCSFAVGYQCSRGPFCLHLQGEVNGNGEKGIYIGLVCKMGAQSSSQKEKGRDGATAHDLIIRTGENCFI
jgi:hypothetical protein